MTHQELQEQFAKFLKTVPADEIKSLVGFQPDESTIAREAAFSKWQELQNATTHCSMLGGAARADALKTWHRLYKEFADLSMGLDAHPVEASQQEVQTAPPNSPQPAA
jgi:hypothetical protein